MRMRHKEIVENIINLLEHVDFTMGCNGEQNALDHIKFLIDFYIEFSDNQKNSNITDQIENNFI